MLRPHSEFRSAPSATLEDDDKRRAAKQRPLPLRCPQNILTCEYVWTLRRAKRSSKVGRGRHQRTSVFLFPGATNGSLAQTDRPSFIPQRRKRDESG